MRKKKEEKGDKVEEERADEVKEGPGAGIRSRRLRVWLKGYVGHENKYKRDPWRPRTYQAGKHLNGGPFAYAIALAKSEK